MNGQDIISDELYRDVFHTRPHIEHVWESTLHPGLHSRKRAGAPGRCRADHTPVTALSAPPSRRRLARTRSSPDGATMAQCLRPRRLIVAAALFSAFAFELLVAQTARESSPQIRQKTFDVVWKTVNDKSFDPRFGGVNWAAVHDRYAPLVAAVTSNRELFDLLDRMLKEIPISHLHLLELDTLDTLLARSVVTTGLALRDVDGQVLVTRVVDGSAGGKAGLRAGFVVKAIDDVAPATARAAEATLAGEKKPHRLTVLDDADTVRDFVIEHQLPPADKLEAVSIGNAKRYAFVE